MVCVPASRLVSPRFECINGSLLLLDPRVQRIDLSPVSSAVFSKSFSPLKQRVDRFL
jgi:hypothetical protein